MLVDSEPEVSDSAVRAAASYKDDWARALPDAGDAPRRALLLAALRRARPVLVRGYEAVVMARLLAEALPPPPVPAATATAAAAAAEGGGGVDAAVDRILRDWPGELVTAMRRFGETGGRADLEGHFERSRAAAMSGRGGGGGGGGGGDPGGDPGGGASAAAWLALNRPYPTEGDALRAAVADEAAGPVFFVSSKKASRVSALLSHHGFAQGVDERSPRLFASLLPPESEKRRALREIMARPAAAGARRLHFVDDRLETLLAVRADGALAGRWRLYLAAWGYGAPGDVEAAARTPGVRVLGRPEELAELLRSGAVGGRDGGDDGDGREPRREEKGAALEGRPAAAAAPSL